MPHQTPATGRAPTAPAMLVLARASGKTKPFGKPCGYRPNSNAAAITAVRKGRRVYPCLQRDQPEPTPPPPAPDTASTRGHAPQRTAARPDTDPEATGAVVAA